MRLSSLNCFYIIYNIYFNTTLSLYSRLSSMKKSTHSVHSIISYNSLKFLHFIKAVAMFSNSIICPLAQFSPQNQPLQQASPQIVLEWRGGKERNSKLLSI